jgi:hypothetical protein
LAGTAYEPWVQLLQFVLVVAVMLSAIAWVLTRRHVITVEHWLWSLVIQAEAARQRASLYAPAAERRRARLDPYVSLAFYGSMGILETLCAMLALVYLLIAMRYGTWLWVVILTLTWAWFLVRLRLDWAAMSWAWHSIATNEEFTWPRSRAS